MDDERCRITVVGTRRRVDLAVPARTAIAEYVPRLAELCGEDQDTDGTFPAVWSLAPAGTRPLPPEGSLTEWGITDGATLYLRDFAAGELDEPAVTEMDELVKESSSQGLEWNTRHRAVTVLVTGLVALVAAVAALAFTAGASQVAAGDAVLAGLGVAVLAGHTTRRSWPLSLAVRLGAALAAVPLIGVGGLAIADVASASHPRLYLLAGVLGGALAARLAISHVLTLTVLSAAAISLPPAAVLMLCGASTVQCAAVAAVLALALLGVVPSAAGLLVSLSAPRPVRGEVNEMIPQLVRQGRRTIAGLTLALCAVLLIAQEVLADSRQPCAIVLAVVVPLALLLRAEQLPDLTAVLPVVVAGLAGVGAAALMVPSHVGAPLWGAPATMGAAAVVLLIVGVVRAMAPAEPLGDRPAWVSGAAGVLTVASVVLAVGVFGVFGQLFHAGSTL